MRWIGALIVFAGISAATPAAAEEPRCITNYGKTACGYECVANFGQVACARTPLGVCHANFGKVMCWDPPRFVVRRRMARRSDARCVSNYGKIACGYKCVANFGDVQCTETPFGQCVANFGKVLCWDPPARVLRRGRPRAEARCVANFGKLACGFQCVANFGDVKCSQTPRGQCRAESGRLVCWDPGRRW